MKRLVRQKVVTEAQYLKDSPKIFLSRDKSKKLAVAASVADDSHTSDPSPILPADQQLSQWRDKFRAEHELRVVAEKRARQLEQRCELLEGEIKRIRRSVEKVERMAA